MWYYDLSGVEKEKEQVIGNQETDAKKTHTAGQIGQVSPDDVVLGTVNKGKCLLRFRIEWDGECLSGVRNWLPKHDSSVLNSNWKEQCRCGAQNTVVITGPDR